MIASNLPLQPAKRAYFEVDISIKKIEMGEYLSIYRLQIHIIKLHIYNILNTC